MQCCGEVFPGRVLPKSYVVFSALSPQTTKPRCRIFIDPFNHDHKVAPFHGIASCVGIILRQFEPSGLKPFYVHDHPAVLGMKQLHQSAAAADEDEDIAVAHIGPHLLLYNSYQGIYSLANIGAPGAQMIAHRIVETEHGSHHALRQHFHQHTLTPSSEVSPHTVGEGQSDAGKLDFRQRMAM